MFWSDSNIFLLINILLWLFTFILYQKWRRYFGIGSLLLLFYLSFAVVGFHLFNHPQAVGWFKDIRLFPYVYLYVMLLLATLPVLKFNEMETSYIQEPSKWVLYLISMVIIVSALSQLFSIVTNFSNGLSKMLVDTSAGEELYSETLSTADQAGDGKIENIAAIISGMFSNISILLLFYFLSWRQKNKYMIAGLSLAVMLYVLSSIATGARGATINIILTVFFTYVLFRNFMLDKTRRLVRRIGIVVIFLILVPITLITISRFDQNDNFGTLYSIEYYYGQSFLNFNNYGLDAGGIRNGDRTASLFKQLIWDNTPRNFLERVDKYSNMKMDESVFYTFVGDFTLDYGHTISFFLFFFASIFFVQKTKVRSNTILFHQLVLFYFILCICVQGTMTLFSFSDIGGNLNIIAFVLTYFWFKIDYAKQQRQAL